jgi:hypothetical protein
MPGTQKDKAHEWALSGGRSEKRIAFHYSKYRAAFLEKFYFTSFQYDI